MPIYLTTVGAAYLLGSIPFGFLLVRLVRKEDIRTHGSGNIGATNVVRSGAKGLGALTFLLDAGKGYAAVLLAEILARHAGAIVQDAATLAVFSAIAGHIFPVWLGFRGGKGVAAAFGGFLALSPLAALITLAIFIAVVALTRYVSVASILSAIALPFLILLRPAVNWSSLSRVLIFASPVLVIAKHRQNISRLARGGEHRFGRPEPEQ